MGLNESGGTYTFLFTDIEGSTHLWETRGPEMSVSLADHDAKLREACERNGGHVFKTVGDAFCVVFDSPSKALQAALDGQLAIAAILEPIPLKVRMALHTGVAEVRNADYFGRTLNRVARLLSGGHGGQVLLSGATCELTKDALPEGTSLLDMGEHRLRDLTRPEHVYQLTHRRLAANFPPLKTLDSLPNNLPKQTTRFIGRERELDELREMLGASRLVTITGSGGAGKTRVALQLAAELLDRYPQGVWFVELATIEDPERIASAVAEALSIPEQPGLSIEKTLRSSLREKELLLVLDNCEHLIHAVAGFTDGLLRACEKVRILASSREPLNVNGERVYRVPALRTPEHPETASPATLERFEAVELFVDRAQSVLPAFEITDRNARVVAGICSQLDGIPLALELAASRLKSLSAQEIHDRLGDAFRILTGGSRTARPRQQTLRGAIDWSYNLLDEKERTLLRRLSVFSGGWDLAAAETVAADPEGDLEDWEVLDLLSSLIDKSLVGVDEHSGETRYRLLETVRQYAAEKLGEGAEQARERHFDYFFDLAEQANAPTEANSEGTLGLRLFRQSDNVRAALHWAGSNQNSLERAIQFAGLLHRTCLMRWNVSEVCAIWDRLLSQAGDLPPTKMLTDAYAHASWYAGQQRDVDSARKWAEAGIAIAEEAGDNLAIGRVLNALGSVHFHLHRFAESEAFYRRGLEVIKTCNYPRADISIGLNLGLCLQAKGDLTGAREAYETVWPLVQKGNDPLNEPLILRYMGELLVEEMRVEQAEAMLERGLRLSTELEVEPYIAEALTTFYGILPMHRGDFETARDRLERGLELSRRLTLASCEQSAVSRLVHVCAASGDFAAASNYLAKADVEAVPPREQAVLLRSAGWLALHLGATELAARLAGSALAIRGLIVAATTPYELEQQGSLLRALSERLEAKILQENFAAGMSTGPAELLRQVMQLESLANSMQGTVGSAEVRAAR